MQNRAYSVLSVKSIDDETRTIRGIATTPSVDRVGDIIDPLGVKFQNPLPFLWQHDHSQPVGHTTFKKPTKDGIEFETRFVSPDEVKSETLKDRLQMAWDSVKTGLVRAVSVGFRPIEYSYMDSGGIRFHESEVFELSAVTIPANSEALITTIKSLDAAARKEAGVPEPETPSPQPERDAPVRKSPVVKLGAAARDRAPFIINKIHPAKPAAR